jgi:hypothetical protein
VVPHRQALRLIVLVGLSSSDCAQTIENLCDKLEVKFPGPIDEFITTEFLPSLSLDVEACFTTSDFMLTFDYRPFYAAAKQLELERFIGIDETGPAIALSPSLLRWRNNRTIRQFIECSILCGIPLLQVSEDLRRLFGGEINDSDLKTFELLFVDRTYASGNNWLEYMKCIGEPEAMFKRKLMGEPHDFVRWKLGVPVSLSSDMVLDRMISDAYYTERLIRYDAENPLKISKDELARIRMERDTIIKCIDRRVKLKESDPKGGKANTDAAAEIRRIVLDFTEQSFPTREEVIGTEAPLLSDLEKSNAGSGPAQNPG